MNPYLQLLVVALCLFTLVATAGESKRAIVYLDSELDLNEFHSVPMSDKAKVVSRSMIQFHQKKAAHIYQWLRTKKKTGDVDQFRALWIVNAIRVHGNQEVLETLKDFSGVKAVVPEEPKEIGPLPGETIARKSLGPVSWAATKTKAKQLWDKGMRGQGIRVAVIDSGATVEHPDLAPNIWENTGEKGRDIFGKDKSNNGRDDDGNGFVDDIHGWDFEEDDNEPNDEHGHGTQTAGVVGGSGSSGTVTGMAPAAKLMILKSCCGKGSKLFESNTWEAIQYAVNNDAKVISMSLSIKHYSKPSYTQWRRVSEAVLATGVIHINSAGNRGKKYSPHNIGAPASNPPAWFHPQQTAGKPSAMLTVGATDKRDRLRRYSSQGPVTWESDPYYKDFPYEDGGKKGMIKPEVCAPSEIPSLSKNGKSYTKSFGGTSSATPVVAGVTALLLTNRPNLTQAQVTEALQNTAVSSSSRLNNKCGAGRIDAVKALKYIQQNF